MSGPGRNDPCHCGSGKKYKKCCLAKDEAAARVPAPAAVAARETSAPATSPIKYEPERLESLARFLKEPHLQKRIEIIRETVRDGAEGGPEVARMLNLLRVAPQAPESRRLASDLAREIRASAPDVYAADPLLYTSWLVEDALEDEDEAAVREGLRTLAQDPAGSSGYVLRLAGPLMYHGHHGALLDLMKRMWPVVSENLYLDLVKVDEFQRILIALTLFDYVSSTGSPRPSDLTLLADLAAVGASDREQIRRDLELVTGQGAESSRRADFSRPLDRDALHRSIDRLGKEWTGHLHREHGITLARADLARSALEFYLTYRGREGATESALLLPNPFLMMSHLYRRMPADVSNLYEAASFLASLPEYLDFLVERGLVTEEEVEAARPALRTAQAILADTLLDDATDLALARDLEQLREALSPRPVAARYADEAESVQRLLTAGEHPDPSLLAKVRNAGAHVVPALITMATDLQLHFGSEASGEAWAPLHAVRLLGEMGTSEAVGPLVPLLTWDDDYLDRDLPEAFGRIGPDAFEPLEALFRDWRQDHYARTSTAQALAKIAESHPALRDRAVAVLSGHLEAADPPGVDDEVLNAFVIVSLCDLKATEALPAIRRAFEEDRVEEFIIDMDYVNRELDPAAARPSVSRSRHKRKARSRRK